MPSLHAYSLGDSCLQYHWYDFVGNIGVVCVLLTYLLLQMQRLTVEDISYSVINGLGAILITVSLLYSFNLSSFLIEMAWLSISLYGVVKALGRDKA